MTPKAKERLGVLVSVTIIMATTIAIINSEAKKMKDDTSPDKFKKWERKKMIIIIGGGVTAAIMPFIFLSDKKN